MKKIIMAAAACAAVLIAAVHIGAERTENVIYKFSMQEPYETKAAFALFSDGALSYCGLYDVEKNDAGEYFITVNEDDAKKGDDAKIILFESGRILKDIFPEKINDTPEASATPELTETPSVMPEPAETPSVSAAPETTLNPVYPKEIDAVSAFAAVKKVTQVLMNDETVYCVDVFYQGRERTFYIKKDLYIASSPDSGPAAAGRDMSALREGDVISIKASLSGGMKDIVLVMRPPSMSPVISGKDYGKSFERLYSGNGRPSAYDGDDIVVYDNVSGARVKYAFGVIADKGASSIMLCGADGKNPLWVDIDRNTCVYKIEAGNSNETSLESISALRKSAVPKEYFDDDGNITGWDSECEYSYALVRIVDDTAADIAFITYE